MRPRLRRPLHRGQKPGGLAAASWWGPGSGRERVDQGLFLLIEGVAEFLVVSGQPLEFLGRAGGGLLQERTGDAVGEVP